MNRILKISMMTIVAVGLAWGLPCELQADAPVTEEQAVQLAEQFIVDNGYTSAAATKSELGYELFDGYINNVDSILKYRQNTLQPKAFCISEDKDHWSVGFLSTHVDLSKLNHRQQQTDLPGRAVIVMKHGKAISIAHKDPLFSYFKKL